MKWDPKTDYGVDEALKDIAYNGSVVGVTFTENGVMKEYDDGHITDYVSADNEKGHNSYDYNQDSSGIWRGESHKSNK